MSGDPKLRNDVLRALSLLLGFDPDSPDTESRIKEAVIALLSDNTAKELTYSEQKQPSTATSSESESSDDGKEGENTQPLGKTERKVLWGDTPKGKQRLVRRFLVLACFIQTPSRPVTTNQVVSFLHQFIPVEKQGTIVTILCRLADDGTIKRLGKGYYRSTQAVSDSLNSDYRFDSDDFREIARKLRLPQCLNENQTPID